MTDLLVPYGFDTLLDFIRALCEELRDPDKLQYIAAKVLHSHVKGDVVFAGYYKNPEATAAVLQDGWFRTGDIGTVDKNNNVFLLGRSKNMILAENGQNVYPEEIEVILNELPYVAESIVLQREHRIVALIVPKMDELDKAGLGADGLDAIMRQNLVALNNKLPGYSAVNDFELRFEPFVKTPKGSIRRFMYK